MWHLGCRSEVIHYSMKDCFPKVHFLINSMLMYIYVFLAVLISTSIHVMRKDSWHAQKGKRSGMDKEMRLCVDNGVERRLITL